MITIEVGSTAKGYSNNNSDKDYITFVKSSKEKYLKHFLIEKSIQNSKAIKKENNEEHVYSDILTGLIGIYTGKYPHLFFFADETNVLDKNLFEFIKYIGNNRIKKILQHCLKYNYHNKNIEPAIVNKYTLQKIYYFSIVDYYLKYKIINKPKLPFIIVNEDVKQLYFKLIPRNYILSEEDKNMMSNYYEILSVNVNALPDDEFHEDILIKINNYLLYNELQF